MMVEAQLGQIRKLFPDPVPDPVPGYLRCNGRGLVTRQPDHHAVNLFPSSAHRPDPNYQPNALPPSPPARKSIAQAERR